MKEFRWRFASSACSASSPILHMTRYAHGARRQLHEWSSWKELSIRRAKVKAMSTHERYPCAMEEPTGRRQVRVKRVDECATSARCFQPLPACVWRRVPAACLHDSRSRDRHGLSAHGFDCRAGDGLGPASGVADSAARNGLGGVCQHDGCSLLSRRTSQPGRAQAWSDSRGADFHG